MRFKQLTRLCNIFNCLQSFNETTSSSINYIEHKKLSLQDDEIKVFSNYYKDTLAASKWSTYWDGMSILKEITPVTYQQ